MDPRAADPNIITKIVNVPLRNVRAREFREIGNGWATDGVSVWCGEPEPMAAAAEFHEIGGGYYDVAGKVYQGCRQLQVVSQNARNAVSATSFRLLRCGFVTIEGAVYLRPRAAADSTTAATSHVSLVDAPTFVIDSTCRTARDAFFEYSIVNDNVGVERSVGARPAPSGERAAQSHAASLPCRYVIKEDSVFYGSMAMLNAEAATFEVVNSDNCHAAIARDRSRVYRQGFPIEGADPATFEILDLIGSFVVARDKSAVYLAYQRITDSDPPSLVKVTPRDHCDLQHVSRFYKDSRHVYTDYAIFHGADPATFEYIEPDPTGPCESQGDYWRDATSVWWSRHKIKGVNPATFTVDSKGRGYDGKVRYLNDRPDVPKESKRR